VLGAVVDATVAGGRAGVAGGAAGADAQPTRERRDATRTGERVRMTRVPTTALARDGIRRVHGYASRWVDSLTQIAFTRVRSVPSSQREARQSELHAKRRVYVGNQEVDVRVVLRDRGSQAAHMTVMVDELRVWPTNIACFKGGSCHLTTDGPLDELHAFARLLGLRAWWFQGEATVPHYDLTVALRAAAVELGAREVSARDQVRMRRAARAMAERKLGA